MCSGERDLVDPDLGEPLAVAVQLADPLLRLVAEHEDLFVLGLRSTVPVTDAPLTTGVPTVTSSPLAARTIRSKVTDEPTSVSMRSVRMTSPSDTRNCLPPVSTIAYITWEPYHAPGWIVNARRRVCSGISPISPPHR